MTFSEALFIGSVSASSAAQADLLRTALDLYRRSQLEGKFFRFWSALTGRPRELRRLGGVGAGSSVNGYYYGLCAVALDQIRGSESRVGDFDAAFHSLRPEDRERWLAVAAAWLEGVPLPPVELIKRGEVYFVRDGHHRISVARALGQSYIDAQVTVWG